LGIRLSILLLSQNIQISFCFFSTGKEVKSRQWTFNFWKWYSTVKFLQRITSSILVRTLLWFIDYVLDLLQIWKWGKREKKKVKMILIKVSLILSNFVSFFITQKNSKNLLRKKIKRKSKNVLKISKISLKKGKSM